MCYGRHFIGRKATKGKLHGKWETNGQSKEALEVTRAGELDTVSRERNNSSFHRMKR